AWARATRLYMPASWLVRRLTGAYLLDHQSASQVSPLYDIENGSWHEPWWSRYAGSIDQPPLAWAGDIAGTVTAEAAALTGIPEGVPVIAGTIDAWTEAVSVGAHGIGDLMLMYGTTMFLIATTAQTLRTPSMWTTAGAFAGTRNLAGGMATSGALTGWLKDLTDADYPQLLAEAEQSGPGARGLLMLPYFAGERTPIQDPDARGVIAGLTLEHTGATSTARHSRPPPSACATTSRRCAPPGRTSAASSPSEAALRAGSGCRSSRTSPVSCRRCRPPPSAPA